MVGEEVKIDQVRKYDVLSGRGNGVANHEGNQFYTKLVKDHKEEYQNNANCARKKEIAMSILKIITNQTPPGRFLKDKKGEAFAYTVQDEQFAMKKVAQALQEKPKKDKDKKPDKSSKGPEREKCLKRGSMDLNSDKACLFS